MKFLREAIGTVALVLATTGHGAGQVIDGPDGPVEFIGLDSWEAQGLYDAIKALDPDLPFHACAFAMKRDLGFAEAASMIHFSSSSGPYAIVIGVEDSARVRHRPTGSEAVAVPEAWQEARASLTDDPRLLSAISSTLPHRGGFLDRIFKTSERLARRLGADVASVDRMWDFVDGADSEADRRLAHDVLASDSSGMARVVATLVLGNFDEDDASWHALAASLTDPHDRVSSLASGTLRRPHPSAGDLRRHQSVPVRRPP